MLSAVEKSIPIVNEKHSISYGNKNIHSLEISLMVCSLLGMTGFCALCTIFFTYSGTFILHICLALIGGIAALIGVFTHFPSALLLYMIIQVASTVYLSIIATLSVSIFFSPNKWKFDETSFLGHTDNEIQKSGAILMCFSLLLIPILICSLVAAIQLFHRCSEEKVRAFCNFNGKV
ncbi:Potassium-transporting ATPase ATP-binding subunit [Dirofilaria immitis]